MLTRGGKCGKLIFPIPDNWLYFDKFDIRNLFFRRRIPKYQSFCHLREIQIQLIKTKFTLSLIKFDQIR